MGGFNPCGCWNLKDGCITIGIWSLLVCLFFLVSRLKPPDGRRFASLEQCLLPLPGHKVKLFCIIQFGLFGWQTSAVKDQKDIASNNYYAYENRPYPGDHERYYEQSFYANRDSRFWTGLFVVQILVLIVTFFLLFATVALIYGIHTDSKYLVWPWFPCMIMNILCCVAYCILWWAGDVQSYWMALTIVEMFGVLVNIYALICVMTYYGKIGLSRDKNYYDSHGRAYYEGGVPPDPYGAQNTMAPLLTVRPGGPRVHFDKRTGEQYVYPMDQQQQQTQYYPQEPIQYGQYNDAYTPDAQPALKQQQQNVYLAQQDTQQPHYQAEPLPQKQQPQWGQPEQAQIQYQQAQGAPPPQGDFTTNWVEQQNVQQFDPNNQYLPQQGGGAPQQAQLPAGYMTEPTTPVDLDTSKPDQLRHAKSDQEFEDGKKRHRSGGRHRSNSMRSHRRRKYYEDSDSDGALEQRANKLWPVPNTRL